MEEKEFKRLFLIEQIFATILSLNNKLQANGDKYSEDITIRQIMAILAIFHIPENQATINSISKKLTSSKQSTKSIISSLENKGYVKVTPSTIDKRAVNVEVTKVGKETIIKNKESMKIFLEKVSSNLTIDEMETLWSLLKKLYAFDGSKMNGFEEEVNYRY